MENQSTFMSNYYTQAMKTWSEMFTYKAPKSGAFFQPISMAKINKAVSKGITSSVEIYDAWLIGMDSLIDEGCKISRKMFRGETIETDRLSDLFREVYDNLSSSIVKSLEETPFESLKEIDNAIKNSLDSLSEEKKIFKELLEDTLNFRSEMIKIFKLSNGNFSQTYSDMLKGKVDFSDDDLHNMIRLYQKTIEHSADMLCILAILNPGCKPSVDETISWAKKTAGIFASWMELTLKPYKEGGKYTMEFYMLLDEALNEGNSIEALYKKWVETMDKAKEIFVKNPSYYENISEFISKNTEFIKSTMELYRSSNHILHTANGYKKSSDESESLSMEAA